MFFPLWLVTVVSIGIGSWLIAYGKMTGTREKIREGLIACSLLGGGGGGVVLGFWALQYSSEGLDGVGWWIAGIFYVLFVLDRGPFKGS